MENKGLTTKEVLLQQEKHGKNVLPIKDPVRWQDVLMDKIKDPLVQLLMIAAVFSIIGALLVKASLIDSYGIILAVTLAVGLGFWNEYSAAKKFEKQNKASEDTLIAVYRDSVLTQVKKSELVVGDIIILEQGTEIPADCIVLEGECQVDEAAVTGENVPVSKFAVCENTKDEHTYSDNFLVGSTPIVAGRVIAKVIKIGVDTEAGKINVITQGDDEKSPLEQNLDNLAELIAKLAFAAAGLMYSILNFKHMVKGTSMIQILFAISLVVLILPVIKDTYNIKPIKNKNVDVILSIIGFITLNTFGFISLGATQFMIDIKEILHVFMEALTLIVVAVPEGLPLAIVLALSNSLKAMLKDNVLIKKLNACETLGCVNTICTDKTGTLTQNIMRCEEVKTFGEFHDNERAFEIGFALNSTAEHGIGNPTELGIIEYFGDSSMNEIRESHKELKKHVIPFSSASKRMYSIYKHEEGFITYCKGAPEIVLSMCDSLLFDDNENPISQGFIQEVNSKIAEGQQRGMRAIGVAYKISEEVHHDNIDSSTGFVFVGYCLIQDPIRKDVPKAMLDAKSMGIDVKICTGDNINTAIGIGRDATLITNNEYSYEGSQVGEITNTEIDNLKILARSKPMDKHTLVNRLREINPERCIAVTGDGTNDAPAMKAAQLGVSMGDATSIAKQTAEVILTDNSFASLIKAIVWGRNIYRNIRKFITFQLTINVSAVASSIICPLIGVGAPFTIVQMLWINIIMDTLAALAFASNKPTEDLKTKKPRKITEGIISKDMSSYIFTTGIIQTIFVLAMTILFKDKSVMFTAFILTQIINMITVNKMDTKIEKHEKRNMSFYGILTIIIAVQVLAATSLHTLFGVEALNIEGFGYSIGFAIIVNIVSNIAVKIVKGRR